MCLIYVLVLKHYFVSFVKNLAFSLQISKITLSLHIVSVCAHGMNSKDMEKTTKIRIKDIALRAGVSEGTVDRVLHNRGEVSAKSREAVEKALTELNYRPNIYARTLAMKRQFMFVFFMPQHAQGDYWDKVEQGIAQAMNELVDFNVLIEPYYYDQFNRDSYRAEAERLLNSNPDGVVIVPTFTQETMRLIQRLHEANVPYSFVDSMVEDEHFVSYYGQHSFQSGWIAAKLLIGDLPKDSEILLVRMRRAGEDVSNQTRSRHEGFMRYLETNGLLEDYKIKTQVIDDEEDGLIALRNYIATSPSLRAVITFNSKVHRLAQSVLACGRKDIRMIGYDLLEKNVDYLREGIVDYLIAQCPERQAYLVLRDLCRNVVLKQPVQKVNYMPIDVLMKENIDYYHTFES